MASTETFVAGEGVVATFTLLAGDYEVHPCTFDPARHRPFELGVYCDSPFTLGPQERGGGE